MNWWEQAYRGGGPADVAFPRPLYPPDVPPASGHRPSKPGPDVLAYKRTICRLGRWGDWEPDSWDEGYYMDFAHGVLTPFKERSTSGVAGFQWQMHIDATGWLGKQTFEALRYALVPEPFPHGGEQAMDSVAIELLDEAYRIYGGHAEPPEGAGKVRDRALALARGELGVYENPAGSNLNPYGAWYGYNGVPWCAIFCTWAYDVGAREIGLDSPSFVKGARYAYVPYIVSDARGRDYGLSTVDDPIPGDLVCYDWTWDGEYDHVGIFERWTGPSSFEAIEGNTSTDNNSNGGKVMRRTRWLGEQALVFVRVAEP